MAGPGIAPLRIVLFGDGQWAARSLARLQATPHRAVAVVLRKRPTDDSLARAAQRAGIPVLQPASAADPALLESLRRLRPDLLLSVAYDQILRAPVLGTAARGGLNFHAGKLPFYRGRNVINWALINGEPEIGLTAHFMDEGIDTGDILLQRLLPVGWSDTYGSVLARLVDELPGLAVESVELVARGDFAVRSQAGLPATYYPARRDGDEWLDWTRNSAQLHNKVRAITRPGPGARTMVDGRETIIWRAHYDPVWPRYTATPGQVVGRMEGQGVLVKTGDATLLVQEVQGGPPPSSIPAWPLGTRLGLDEQATLRALLARVEALESRRHPADGGIDE